ncbi:MAG: hypothetical protein ABFD70_09270 [Syntrophaceae bacterium]|nr:hypothetical protein [Deltaproteobacteria bacterium]
MRKAKIVLFILLFGVSTAFADTIDDALGQKASLQVRMSTREMVKAGVTENDAVMITRLMIQSRYQERQILQVHQAIREMRQEGLPAEPSMNKVREGIAKRVEAGLVVRAMEQTRARYSYAYRQARSLSPGAGPATATLGDTIAEGMTAGMAQGDVDRIVLKLKIRQRSMDKDRLHLLAQESFAASRDMVRSGAASATGAEVVCQALEHSWQYQDMEKLRLTFMSQVRTRSAQGLATRYSHAIRNGAGSDRIGSDQAQGSPSPGAGKGSGSNGSGSGSSDSGSGGSSNGGSGSGSSGSGSGSGHGGDASGSTGRGGK